MEFFYFIVSVALFTFVTLFTIPTIIECLYSRDSETEEFRKKYRMAWVVYLLTILLFILSGVLSDSLCLIGFIVGNLLSLGYGIYHVRTDVRPEFMIKDKEERKEYDTLYSMIETLKMDLKKATTELNRLKLSNIENLERNKMLADGVYEDYLQYINDKEKEIKKLEGAIETAKILQREILDKYRK